MRDEDSLTEEDILELTSEPQTLDGQIEAIVTVDKDSVTDDAESTADPSFAAPKPTIYDVSCAGGVKAQFRVPIQAFYWHARVHFYRPNTTLLVKWGVAEWPASYEVGTLLKAQWTAQLPRGIGSLRVFYWYGTESGAGPIYWDSYSQTC